MLTFCPICANVLVVEEGPKCLRFACNTCPYIQNITRKISHKKYPKLKEVDDVLGGGEAWENVDSTADLDLLLGDYTDYDKEQLSDECFDGDNYTDSPVYDEASWTTGPKQAKDHKKENKKARYACPLCRKTYMSIRGFRGHVTKKHNRSDIKAHEHRLDSPGGSNPPDSTCTANTPVPMSKKADMQDALKAVLSKSISTVILDPMNDSSCSVNGPHLITIAKECIDNQTVQEKLISVLIPEFQEVFLQVWTWLFSFC
ncbi:uncharacterized protein LOC124149986 isoform X2 [Haliotis rufescens]|uniref:uncharacterized protein LOC124149986 isoform X2 n=1 Tax=Haliotis rufescens TaxID=6454 RepID=UPI00201E9264|nr:uncharacterized protein LOC124149986 isoform X2 [Haliotis rufescens]